MMWYFSRARRLASVATVSIFATLVLASVATAQQFRTDPVDDKARSLGRSGTIWVRDRGAYDAGKAQFDEYFTKFYFPAMTRSTPSGLADVGALRVNLFKKYLWATSNEQLQANLTAMAFKAMAKIVGSKDAPPYHPAVRYNAILVLGLLDDEYAIDGGAGARPPKPHANANRALAQIVNSATDARFPPPVILGAVIGLERHAKYPAALPPEQVTAMTAALLKLVNNDKPIQNMNPDAYAWLRLRAASALANLGKPGENNAVHDSIVKLTGSLKSYDDRCAAAALLAKLNYKDSKIDGPATTKELFKLAGDLSAEELKRALDYEKVRSTGGFTGGRGEVLNSNDPNAEQDDGFPREHMLTRLYNLRRGLRAVREAVPADAQKEVDAVLAAIQPSIVATSDESAVPIAITNTIRTMNDQLVELVGAPEAAEEDEFSVGGDAAAGAAADAPAAPAPPAAATPPPAVTPPAQTPPAEAPVATPAETSPAAPTN